MTVVVAAERVEVVTKEPDLVSAILGSVIEDGGNSRGFSDLSMSC